MNIQTEKDALMKRLEQVNDLSLIQAINHLVDYGLKEKDYDSIDRYNKELDEADKEIEKGEFLTHEEAVNQISSWREK